MEAFLFASMLGPTEARVVWQAFMFLALAASLLAVLIAIAMSIVFLIARIYVGQDASTLPHLAAPSVNTSSRELHKAALISE